MQLEVSVWSALRLVPAEGQAGDAEAADSPYYSSTAELQRRASLRFMMSRGQHRRAALRERS